MMFARISKTRLSSLRVASPSRAVSGVASVASMPRATKSLAAVTLAAATALVVTSTPPLSTDCHCQVPCGIFDDPIRVALLKEHAATIKKAMLELDRIAEKAAPSGEQFQSQDFNQAARWVVVKEEAASAIMEIVSTYMLAQRVKKESFESAEEYHKVLELHHTLLQSAMKTKQTVDLDAFLALQRAIANVEAMYTK